MTYNSSRLLEDWCSFLMLNFSRSSSVYYEVTLTSLVVTSFLAPLTVVGNALIMAAIWKNWSLRTPSYVLLAGLALTDFCTGLMSQPFYVAYQWALLAGNRKMICIAGVITQSAGYYLSSLTVLIMTVIAVERWLHMSRRNLLTVGRVTIINFTFIVLLIAFFSCHVYNWSSTDQFFSAFVVIFILGAALCFTLIVFAYFKVFQIIRHHQSQVQSNRSKIDMKKYKKSVFTILYILAIFLLSYVPYVCCLLVVISLNEFGTKSSAAALNACAVVVFSSSCVNPLLYYCRIKEVRDVVRTMVRKLCYKKMGEAAS